MNQKTLMVAAISIATASRAESAVLYDARSNVLPNNAAWGWSYVALGGTLTPPNGNDRFTLDTMSSLSNQAGFSKFAPFILNSTAGYTVRLDLRITAEEHPIAGDRNGDGLSDRAGFSLIVLGSNKKGIELSFWGNEVWPQDDNPLFIHQPAIERAFVNTAQSGNGIGGLQRFEVRFTQAGYVVYREGLRVPILAGPLKDYTPFSGFPDPYENSNWIFMGDNTTSARARTEVSFVSVTPFPVTN